MRRNDKETHVYRRVTGNIAAPDVTNKGRNG
jgi:hypothetical protein